MFRRMIMIASLCTLPAASFAADTPSVAGASVYIISPKNGDTISGPVRVQFGLKGMGIAPAGTAMEGTGHHHLVIDKTLPPLDAYLPPDDPQVRHFGKGQTEVELKLAPGTHTLQLVFGDQDHKPHKPALVSEKVTITVK